MMAQQTFAITIGRYLDFVDVGERDHEGDEDEVYNYVADGDSVCIMLVIMRIMVTTSMMIMLVILMIVTQFMTIRLVILIMVTIRGMIVVILMMMR